MENIFVKTVLNILPKHRAIELLDDYNNCSIGEDFKKAYSNVMDRHKDMKVNNASIDLFIDALKFINKEEK